MAFKEFIDKTPVVFCAVIAVKAVIAYPPNEVAVLISAWIPAPPDESDPAMIKILVFGFNMFDAFFNYPNTFLNQSFII